MTRNHKELVPLDQAFKTIRDRCEAVRAQQAGAESISRLCADAGVNPSKIVLIARGDMTTLNLKTVVRLAAHWGIEIPTADLKRLA